MRNTLYLLLGFFMFAACNEASKTEEATTDSVAVAEPIAEEAASGRQYYQMKIYQFDTEEQIAATDQFLQNAYLPGMKALGVESIGVFKERLREDDTVNKTYVFFPLTSLAQLDELESKLWADATFQKNGADYLNASHENPPYKRIENIVLKAFVDMPQMATPAFETPRSERVYELRSYESYTENLYWNKVDMFNAGGEVKLFSDLEFNAVFYAEVIAGSHQPNLMYMTTFSNQESRDAHWDAFRTSPVWEKLKDDPKYQNNVSHNDTRFLYPTDYSDY